jgi:uncharacterized membrane protein AbrB (regulator of aidB expression)
MSRRKANWSGLYIVAVGLVLVLLQIPIAWLFGVSVVDVLLVREPGLVVEAAIAHGIVLLGLWVLVRPLLFPDDPGEL